MGYREERGREEGGWGVERERERERQGGDQKQQVTH